MGNETKTNRLLKGILIYAVGDFGSKILTFLIVPLYTYYISPESMGTYDILLNTVGLLSPLITLQISDAAYRWLVDPDEENAPYIRATLQLLLHNCLLAAFVILVINRFVSIPYCLYFLLTLLTTRCLNTVKKLVRGVGNQKLFAVSGIVYTLVYLALNIVQIVYLGRGVHSLFTSAVLANLLTLAFLFLSERQLRVNLLQKPEIKRLQAMLRYSTPLVPNLLNWWVINSSDRYIVRYFLGLAANGILSIAGKFPTALDMVIGLFSTSWQDISIADRGEIDGGENAYYSGVFRSLYRLTLSLLWFLIPVTKVYILLTMEKGYAGAADIVAFYYLGSVFRGFSSFYGVGYLRSGHTRKAFQTSVVAAVVNVVVHLGTISFLGLQAAPLSTFIAFFTMWIIRQRHNQEELGIRINVAEFAMLLVTDIALSAGIILMPWTLCTLIALGGGICCLIYNRVIVTNLLMRLRMKVKHI